MSLIQKACPLVLVGAGKMGGAMLSGWLKQGLDPDGVVIVDPSPAPEMAELAREKGLRMEVAAPEGLEASVIVLAVKPQVADQALPSLARLVGPETVAVSIMAGKTLARMEASLGAAAIVRAMPNTPAQVGRGITVCVGNDRVTAAHRELISALLAAVGAVEWVEEEGLIDQVTAVSGSGPAYVFHLVEAMTLAGTRAGLPAALAEKLARATVEGAGELLFQSPLTPATLRQNVTSPGGTTAAALAVLMGEEGIQPLFDKAIAAATRRSRELAG
jgi:pyrroline-5-carboxylate reductase